MSGSAITLRILHLSDVHFRFDDDPTSRRTRKIELETPHRCDALVGNKWHQAISTLLKDGPIDLVFFTGDIADWGKTEEFSQATPFLDELLSRLGLTRDRLFVVPGNHDLDRSIGFEAWEAVRAIAGQDRNQTSRWMFGLDPPAGIDPSMCERVLHRYAAFWSWLERDLERAELLPRQSPHGRLGYRVDVGPRLGLDIPVWIIGLDTAWLAGDNDDSGRLMLTEHQIRQLSTNDGVCLPGLRLVLAHHPLNDLADADLARQLLANYADLYLHGHQHVCMSAICAGPDHNVLELAAGCLFEGSRTDGHVNGHTVVTLHLDEAGRPQRSELRLRSWSMDSRCWFDDSSIYPQAVDGRLNLSWETEDGVPYSLAAGDAWVD